MSADVVKALRGYLDRIFADQPGMKALIMDRDTCQMVSMVYSQHELLQNEVFLSDFLDNKARSKKAFLKAIVLAKPTQDNMAHLKRELHQPTFASYHIFWTSTCSDANVKALAEYDKQEKVSSVQEYYVDYFALDSVSFSAGVSPAVSACLNIPQINWSGQETRGFGQCIDST
mgnify:FL=1